MYMHTVVCMCVYVYVNCACNECVLWGCREHCICVCTSVCIRPRPACMDACVCAWYLCMHTASLTTDWASLILLRSRSSVAWGSWLHGLYFSFLIPHVTAGNTALISKPWERIFNETNAHTAVLRYRCFLLVAIDFQLDILERQGVKRKWDTKEAGTVPSQPGPVQS